MSISNGHSVKDTDILADNNLDLAVTKPKQSTGDGDKEAMQNDVEVGDNPDKVIRYPRSIPFIVVNEFCERFNFYGMRAILALYLVQKLNFNEDGATVVFHVFTTSYYFLCIIGAIIADSWWGKFKTILILSFVYVLGNFTITAGAIPQWDLPGRTFTFIGLTLVAVGAGGIKSCVAAFGGDQFKLPEQAEQLARFFSIFYFSINLGSFISSLITPILRDDVNCFGEDDCFSLGFFVPATLMIASIIIFIIGKPLYVIKGLQGNMLVKVSSCISEAITQRFKNKDPSKQHWLDYSEKKYGSQLVKETKILLNVLVLYIPLPFFWALFDQQGSRWTFQATRMDGNIGFYDLKPDQAQILNPLLILVFIPLYEWLMYPLLKILGIRRPLQKLALGMIMAALAFLISATLEWQLMKTYAEVPKVSESHLRLYNSVDCEFEVSIGNESRILERNSFSGNWKFSTKNSEEVRAFFTSRDGCSSINRNFQLSSGEAVGFLIRGQKDAVNFYDFVDDPEKSKRGDPKIKVLTNFQQRSRNVRLVGGNTYESRNDTEMNFEVTKGVYDLFVDNAKVDTLEFKQGAVYALVITDTSALKVKSNQVTQPNTVSILWIIPQYVVVTLGEVMFSVTGIQFSYAEAPSSMKSVLNGCWQLTSAFGNLIIVIIAELNLFDDQIWEFILFACIMFVDTAFFAFLAIRYKSIPLDSEDQDTALTDPNNVKLPDSSNKQD